MNAPAKTKGARSDEPTTRPRQVVFVSLRWKLLVGFTLLFSVVFAIAFYWFYSFATDQALTRIQQDLVDTLLGSAELVDDTLLLPLAAEGQPNAAGEAWLAAANAEEAESPEASVLRETALAAYGEATPAGFSDNPRYQQLMDQLAMIHEIEPRAWPYVYIKGEGEREIVYIADLWARFDPAKSTPFLFARSSRRSYNGLNELTLRLDENDRFTPYTDDWGRWVSAYAPIQDSSGQSVGALGVDFEADYVFQVQEAIRDRVVIAFLVTYFTLFALVYFVSHGLTQPILKLTEAAGRLGEGDYSQDLSLLGGVGRLRDEINTLAEVFTIMTNKVYQREQTLRRQVEALRIEIDEAKRQRQVSEIADSTFFQQLQKKARQMRGRQGKPDDQADQS